MKYIIGIIVMLLAASPIVYARDGADDNDVEDVRHEDRREDRREDRHEDRRIEQLETKAQKETLKEERDVIKDQFKAEIKERKDDFKAHRDAFKEEWKRTATRTPELLKARIDEMKIAMKEDRESIRMRLASSTKEIKARFDDVKKDRVKERIANVSGKFDGAVSRIQLFDDKVTLAIARFKENGVDTSDADALLAVARASLDDLKEKVDVFDARADAVLAEDEVSRLALKEEVVVVTESIRSTHAAYVDVVAELKASGAKQSN